MTVVKILATELLRAWLSPGGAKGSGRARGSARIRPHVLPDRRPEGRAEFFRDR